jgi:uncharacterized membrane protein YkoI
MRSISLTALVLALSLGPSAVAITQQPATTALKQSHGTTMHVREAQPGMAARAKVSLNAARLRALAGMKNGRITSEMLEQRGGKLVYVLLVQPPGSASGHEVIVDAMDGKVLKPRNATGPHRQAHSKERG